MSKVYFQIGTLSIVKPPSQMKPIVGPFNEKVSAGIPCFLKVRFDERPTIGPIFANQKKCEGDFRFYKKRGKVKIVFSVCLAESHDSGRGTLSSEWHCQAPSPGTTLSISAPELGA